MTRREVSKLFTAELTDIRPTPAASKGFACWAENSMHCNLPAARGGGFVLFSQTQLTPKRLSKASEAREGCHRRNEQGANGCSSVFYGEDVEHLHSNHLKFRAIKKLQPHTLYKTKFVLQSKHFKVKTSTWTHRFERYVLAEFKPDRLAKQLDSERVKWSNSVSLATLRRLIKRTNLKHF